MDPIITEYIQSLDEKQQQALAIAREHLGTSFDIQRSNGYKEWQKKRSLQTIGMMKSDSGC